MRIKLILGVKNIIPASETLQFALDENEGSVGPLENEIREGKANFSKDLLFWMSSKQCAERLCTYALAPER